MVKTSDLAVLLWAIPCSNRDTWVVRKKGGIVNEALASFLGPSFYNPV